MHCLSRLAISIESEIQAWIDREMLRYETPTMDLVLKLKFFSSLETTRALASMGSVHSVEVLCSLIRAIRSLLVDEIESNGEILKVITLLNSRDLQLQVLALECVFEIGYFGRMGAVDAMVKAICM
ncbi:hypothetical protein VNO80_01218 [Phaseolus coccineus]|uniref:Uncharacterized protein n=1 Tax=Phaseolus coccineus TaxID=3886 RepID=A0AAN9RRE5_PHACN